MQITNFKLEAYLIFTDTCLEEFFEQCELAITHITEDLSTRYRLKSAVQELVVNSMEHGYNGEAGKVSVSLKNDNGSIHLEVCDEGSGVQDILPNTSRLTDDIDSISKRGWGLLITSGLSSNIQVTRNEPKGTIVTITMPAV